MSLGMIFKGPEGIVLAADSRVTLNATIPNSNPLIQIPATFDYATKLLKVEGQDYAGAITYGLGALGGSKPRTAHSFLPEFEANLKNEGVERLEVEDFAKRFSNFYLDQYNQSLQGQPPLPAGNDMIFLIGGYDNNEPYGRVYEFAIPSKPDPLERCAGGDFGGVWGGQRDIVDRLLNGIDPGLTAALKDALKLSDTESRKLVETIGPRLSLPIPYAFLPLQDCVDMVTLLIRTTINVQKWMMGVRGVGGAIDVATITRTRGFEPVQIKAIRGESRNE